MMKLGNETGSLVNHIMSRANTPVPEVGMGATVLSWSDRYAGTIIEVKPKRLVVQLDKATRVDKNGVSENQQYDYERDPNGVTYVFKLFKDGSWKTTAKGYGLLLGHRQQYYDFSF